MDQEQEHSNKGLWIVIAVAIIALVGGIVAWFLFARGGETGEKSWTAFFGDLGEESPRGNDTSVTPPITENSGGFSGNSELPRLRKISSLPSVGATEYTAEDGTSVIRYMGTEKGNIYDIDLRTGKEVRITNETLPRVHDAHFGTNAKTVVFRYVDSLGAVKTQLREVYIDPAKSTEISGSLSEGESLPDNVTALSISPDGNTLFYLTTDESGNALGRVIDLPTRTTRTVFFFPFSEWIPEVLRGGLIRLTTKASALYGGYSYAYDPSTKTLKKMIDENFGLTTNYSPSGKRVIYSAIVSKNLVLGNASFPDDEEDHAPVFGFTTLPEKCAWAPDETRVYCGVTEFLGNKMLPDDWYKGTFTFDDTIWSFDFRMNSSDEIARPGELAGVSVDVTDPFVTKDGSTLIFTDKKEGYLWALTLGLPFASQEEGGAIAPEEIKDVLGSSPENTGSTTAPAGTIN